MSFTSNPYCEVADVQSALYTATNGAYPVLSQPDSAFLQDLIEEAQSFIDNEIGHSYQTDGTIDSPATRIFDGDDTDNLFIGEFVSFSQVLETSTVTQLQGNQWVQVTSTTSDITADCIAGPNNRTPFLSLRRINGSAFLQGKANYTVKGVFGNPTIPSDIKRACTRLTVHWYLMRKTAYASAAQTQGQPTLHYTHAVPDDVQAILDNHHRRVFSTGR